MPVLDAFRPAVPCRRKTAVLGVVGKARARIVSVPPMSPTPGAIVPSMGLSGSRGPEQVLLRKEVIQPHLPVRLPCYDFVPIADPTFDSSLPYGLGHWLRVLPTFVT